MRYKATERVHIRDTCINTKRHKPLCMFPMRYLRLYRRHIIQYNHNTNTVRRTICYMLPLKLHGPYYGLNTDNSLSISLMCSFSPFFPICYHEYRWYTLHHIWLLFKATFSMWAVLLGITKAALRMVYTYAKLFGVFIFSIDAFLYISFFLFLFLSRDTCYI